MDDGPLELRRKRLRYRCAHRGTKELDFMVGAFAERFLPDFCDSELTELEQILELPEPLLHDLLLGNVGIPPSFDGPVMERLHGFHARNSGG